jgi:hypothetical protein
MINSKTEINIDFFMNAEERYEVKIKGIPKKIKEYLICRYSVC